MVDMQQAAMEYAELFMDKSRIKFIEKYLYTFNAVKNKKTPFILFPRQRVFLETLAGNRNVVSIKPRQCGITTLTSAWVTAQCAFADKDAPETILCIGNRADLAQEIITKIRDFLVQVPRWYWGDDYYSPDPNSAKNRKSIFVKDSKTDLELFNGCKVKARSSGTNAARGISAVSILILDEAAFIDDGVAVYATAAATMASNPNAKTVMVSTPNGKDQLYYNTYRLALAKENNFIAVQFRWYQDPRYNKNLKWYKKIKSTGEIKWIEEPVIDNEGSVKYDEQHWEDLVHDGWTPTSPWYVEMCKQFNNDRVKIAQELDVSFVGSSDNVIDPEYITMQENLNSREPLEDMKDPMEDLTWFWKAPIEGHRYIASCLPEGQKVMTDSGERAVEEITYDDKLLTKDGEYTDIQHIMTRPVDEEIVEIVPNGTVDNYRFTKEHPIWASKITKGKFDFFKASVIKKGHWLQIPNHYYLNSRKKLSGEYIINDKNILKDDTLWWLIGMYLQNGRYINDNEIGIYIPDKLYTDKIKKKLELFSSEYNIKLVHRHILSDKLNRVSLISEDLFKFFENHYSFRSNTHIDEWTKKLPSKYKSLIINGFFYCVEVKNHYFKINHKSVASGIQDILFSLGIVIKLTLCNEERYVLDDYGKFRFSYERYFARIDGENLRKVKRSYVFKDGDVIKTRRICNDVIYLSNDNRYVFIRVKMVRRKYFIGTVYNFETVSDSHTFCCSRIATHNCDVSRGSSDDFTAIEIIDMDGSDENGMPIVEQVAQYYGKKLGDDVGELLYNYATLYNDAYVVIDCTNGLGDVPLFTLIHKGYKNLYYDDSELKKYTVQNSAKPFKLDTLDVMPGFHMQGNRYPVLSNFANMVRNNEFKIRSIRTINELNTWIFKGEAKRIDHMDGCHDDSITCLAIGLFVMMYSYKKMEKAQSKDKAILSAYYTTKTIGTSQNRMGESKTISPGVGLPFYNATALENRSAKNVGGSFMWLFGGVK